MACSRCKRPLLANEPRGLCSRCLFASLVEGADAGVAAPAVEAPPRLATLLASTGEVGERLGRYRLLKKIGEGGCGVVFMAQQTEPVHRQVALKIVKLGMGSKEVLNRFEAERQALAVMDHPNIAKIYDAGMTDTGLPYFVMELAAGSRITRFCEGRRLALRDRLTLFIKVCRAIQHAHQKGIVHRDIKPSNILVSLSDGVPVPKVIDFGIAKATQGNLTDKTLFTVVEHFLGTPAYMSPEQAGIPATDIDTRSDIYSLGVLLYELLTGRTPFDGGALLRRGIEELILTLREVEPPRPSVCVTHLSEAELATLARSQQVEASTLIGELRGDLDWIVMKCLEKDRARRYETVNGLAMDLQRHLDHEPVLARPPSVAYRLNKTISRHKLAVLAGSLVVASLVVGLALASFGLIQAAEQRRIAQKEQEGTQQALARAQAAIAEAAFRAGDGIGMKAALDAVPQAWRNTTWEYLAARADTSQATLNGSFVGVASHPLRPGVFALGERGGGIVLIQGKTGERLQHIDTTTRQQAGHYYRGLAFTPDGERLAVGSLGRGGIAIYDVASGAVQIEWEAPETDTLEFSPDGGRLLQSSTINGQVCLWDAARGRMLWNREGTTIAVFDSGANRVIAAEKRDLVLLNAIDGTLIGKLGQLRGSVQAMAVRPGGRVLAAGDSEGFVYGVDLADGHFIFQMPSSTRRIRFVDFTADGGRVVSVAAADNQNQAIHVWDADTGTRLQSIIGGSSKPEGMRLHPLTDDLVIAGSVTRTWGLGVERPRWKLPAGSTAAFFGPDDSCFASTGNGIGSFVLEGTNMTTRWTYAEGWRSKLTVSADGRVAALTKFDNLANETLILRSTEPGFKPSTSIKGVHAVSFVRLSPGGERLLVFVPGGKSSGHFDTITGAPLPALLEDVPVAEIIDADWIDATHIIGAVTARDLRGGRASEERLMLWDAATGQVLRSERSATIMNCLAAAPGRGSFAEAGDDEIIRIREGKTLALQKSFRAHDGAITALAWHPKRGVLASASEDLTIKLWDTTTGVCLGELRGPVRPALMLHFSSSGRRLISSGTDSTRVWELKALEAAQP